MIDLRHTRAGLLAEIEAPDLAGDPSSDIADLRATTAHARVRVSGHSRDELFPILKVALCERFAAVPRAQLIQDLLMPLKHALGNAYKHGNARDPSKVVSVEIVLGVNGALIAVTDQGEGFDVPLTLRRFHEQEAYYQNHGCGFHNLHRATSTVTYESGGRTVLLCFRPAIPPGDPAGSVDVASVEVPTGAAPKAVDAAWIRTALSAAVPDIAGRVEACHVYATGAPAGDDCGHRYVLRLGARGAAAAGTRIFTGRLHAAAATAEHDSEVARRLHEAPISRRVLIPRPVAPPATERRLVFYDFDPWMNLREYLTYRGSLKALRRSAERIGEALAGLHRSPIELPVAPGDPVGNGLHEIVARAEATLRARSGVADLVARFRRCTLLLEEWAGSRRRRPLAPTHGAFGWDCVHYGVDGRFYLYRFETCRRSDPGLDLGGFAADLLYFTLAGVEDRAYRICEDAFLSNYNADAEHPMDGGDLPFYVAIALLQRLQRSEPRANTTATHLLAALDVALGQAGRAS